MNPSYFDGTHHVCKSRLIACMCSAWENTLHVNLLILFMSSRQTSDGITSSDNNGWPEFAVQSIFACMFFNQRSFPQLQSESLHTFPWAFSPASKISFPPSADLWTPRSVVSVSSHTSWAVACSYISPPRPRLLSWHFLFFISYFLLPLLYLPLCDPCATHSSIKVGGKLCARARVCVCVSSRSLKRWSFDLFLHFALCVQTLARLLTHLVLNVCVCLCVYVWNVITATVVTTSVNVKTTADTVLVWVTVPDIDQPKICWKCFRCTKVMQFCDTNVYVSVSFSKCCHLFKAQANPPPSPVCRVTWVSGPSFCCFGMCCSRTVSASAMEFVCRKWFWCVSSWQNMVLDCSRNCHTSG